MNETGKIVVNVVKQNNGTLKTLAVMRGVLLVATAYVCFLTACQKYKNSLTENVKTEESTEK
jgi:hypothetical protein